MIFTNAFAGPCSIEAILPQPGTDVCVTFFLRGTQDPSAHSNDNYMPQMVYGRLSKGKYMELVLSRDCRTGVACFGRERGILLHSVLTS